MAPTSNSQEGKAEGFPLNSQQSAAVAHGDGPMLVVAGAGTGKTRVITERIRRLLEDDPDLAGDNILGLTFTDKAAGEMKHRVVKAAGERAEKVWLGTFHSFCLEKILQAAHPEIQPLDDIDHGILLRRNIGELNLQIFRRLAEPAEFLRDFVAFFSRCQDELVTPDDYDRYVEELARVFEACKGALDEDARGVAEEKVARQRELARVYRTSERLLRERNLYTFGAQLLQSVQLLKQDAALLGRLREQYRYIVVDEFQDTNIAQLELLSLLAGKRGNILAVGDDDQAIYRFRGASFASFTIFLDRFCGVTGKLAEAGPGRFLISLSQNYRATRRILRVAGETIAVNEKSPLLPPKQLTTENSEGDKVRVVEFANFEEEAHWVAADIERLHAAGAAWRDFAVLYRKHSHRENLVAALRRRGIPFVIRKFSILSNTLVRDLLAWMRLVAVPTDNISCARVIAAPYWGLEPRDLVRLTERADKNHRRPLWDEVAAAQQESQAGASNIWRREVHLTELVETFNRLRQCAREKTAPEFLQDVMTTLCVASAMNEEDRPYVERLTAFVKEWERKSEGKQLRDFIEYLGYFYELGGDITIEEQPFDDAVQLMTVHGAKGLEFTHVYILRLSKYDFPSSPRRPKFEFPSELMKEEQPKEDFHIQEERRLFYVALTRAKRHLTLSTIVNRRKKPSPFLDDFLRNGTIQRRDVNQFEPKVSVLPPEELPATATVSAPTESASLQGQLFSLIELPRAYSRVALWAKSFHPPRPEPLQLSSSAITTYEQCPMKYLFRHVWGIRGGPRPETTFGNVMHSTIREFVSAYRKGGKVSLEDLWMIYDREWSSAGFPDDYHEEEYRRAGREQLEVFHRRYTAAPPEALHQEKGFELPLPDDVVVTGRIDQINRMADGGIEIVDYKTGKPRSEKQAEDDLQLSVYALAAREVLDLEPGRLVFYNLMTNEEVAGTRDTKALAETRDRIAAVADQIRAREFPARHGFGCNRCDYRPLCPAHEQLITIRSGDNRGA
jgi:DNA helicase II / ATP-dependent DNA helicase PcrA